MGINLFLVKSRSSTIQDLFLFVFTQDILHYLFVSLKELFGSFVIRFFNE
ncbi:hypothetical protein SAG0170_06295 [Streptococcus agalactiae LDS 617]|nr:hypothetical protein SAG0170_06295 [Streptococcus agalactiae LDS 617]